MPKRLKRDRPNVRTCLTGAVVLAMLLSPLSTAHAKDNILASAYGPVVMDILFAFFAIEVPCLGAIDTSDVCFTVEPTTAGALAETIVEVVDGYTSAGLQSGTWRSANGVWAVELRFGEGAYGFIEVYLTETKRAEVHGKVVYRTP